MEFKEIVSKRYATKKFDGKRIPEDKIEELLELIRLAPSAINLQPWKIKIVSDQKTKEDLLPATWNQQQVTTCSHLLVFCAFADMDKLIANIEKGMKAAGVPEQARNFVVGLARDMSGRMSPAQRLAWAQSQLYLALGNAVNGAKSLGFDSCPMSGFDPEAYSRILNLPGELVPTLLCPVGYAADSPLPKVRFPKEEIFF
jgi:nitroreductase